MESSEFSLLLCPKDNPALCMSGYGKMGSYVTPILMDAGYDVRLHCPVGHHMGVMQYRDQRSGHTIQVWSAGEGAYGENIVPAHLQRLHRESGKQPLCLFIGDVPALNMLPQWSQRREVLAAAWAAVDWEWPTPKHALDKFASFLGVMPMSQHGFNVLQKDGLSRDALLPAVWLGVNPEVWKPASRGAYPDTMKSLGFREDSFNVFSAFANQFGRKGEYEMFVAVGEFHKRHPEANIRFFAFTQARREWDLPALAEHLGIRDLVYFSDDYAHIMGDYAEEDVARMMNCADVVLSVGYEGFGLQTIEALSCFPAGTSVATNRGHVKIEDVRVGDSVLTHTGLRQKVMQTMKRHHAGDLIRITPWGDAEGIACTPAHPWLVKRDGKRSFIPAAEMRVGDFVCLPRERVIEHHVADFASHIRNGRNQAGEFEGTNAKKIPNMVIDPPLARFFGLYVAEGGASHRIVPLSFHVEEVELHEAAAGQLRRMGLHTTVNHRGNQNTTEVRTSSVILSRFVKQEFGEGAKTKHLPAWAIRLPPEEAANFLRGMWEGDGTFYVDRTRYLKASYSTASRSLAYDMRLLMARFGCYGPVQHGQQSEGTLGAGNDIYQVRVSGEQANWLAEIVGRDIFAESGARRWHHVDEEYVNVEVRNVEHIAGNCTVYNLEVEEDNSYTVNGFAVHNCNKPVIGFDAGATPELLTTRGVFIPPDREIMLASLLRRPMPNGPALVEALEWVWQNKDHANVPWLGGHEWVKENATWAHSGRGLIRGLRAVEQRIADEELGPPLKPGPLALEKAARLVEVAPK